jgi:GT2 family glycosyltransferase
MMKVAVVILNWNGRKWLEQFLPSVSQYSAGKGVDLVVADNASTDDSVAFLKENYPQIRLLCLESNYGFAEGYNRALAQIDAEYVVLLNSDVEVTPGWLVSLTAFLDSHPDVAAVQPKILAERQRDTFEYAGAAGGFIDKYGYPFCRGRIFSEVEKDKGQYDSPVDVFWATGACLMIRLEVFNLVGGLDGSFFAHMEEIDLCWRLRSRGYRIVCVPNSVVYHVGGGTLSQESPHKTFLNFRNNLLMLYKNLPDGRLSSVMLVRLLLDYVTAAQFLLSGNTDNAKAVFRARREFKHILPQYKSKRDENRRNAVLETIPEMYQGLLIWAFYLKSKKLFSDIF